jgi:RNA polymerase sigma factor (sigma-70 family)
VSAVKLRPIEPQPPKGEQAAGAMDACAPEPLPLKRPTFPELDNEQRKQFEKARHLVEPEALKLLPRVGHVVDLEDLKAWGDFGLVIAMRRFDTSLGTDWTTYAKKCIACAMLDAVQKEVRGSPRLALAVRRAGRGPLTRFIPQGDITTDSPQQTRAQLDDFYGVMLGSLLVATAAALHNRPADEQLEVCEAEQGLSAVLDSLKERDRTMIVKSMQGVEKKQIAAELGISAKTVTRALDRIVKLIHVRLHGKDIDGVPPYPQEPVPSSAPKKRHG